MIFEGCLDSNPECCRRKLALYRLSHRSLKDLATYPSLRAITLCDIIGWPILSSKRGQNFFYFLKYLHDVSELLKMGGLNNGKEGGAEVRSLKLGGHVGFDSMPDQLVNKSVQNGFCFNILSIGETGIGKSTLADSLFNTRKRSLILYFFF
jgi:hypothetical protein